MIKKITLSIAFCWLTQLCFAQEQDIPQPIERAPRIFTSSTLSIPQDISPDMVRDAGSQAITLFLQQLFEQPNLPKRYAILPLKTDLSDGYFTSQFRNLFTHIGSPKGFELFTRMDDEWKTLLQEIKWGQQFNDIMDAETIQKFGKIKGIQSVLIGRIVSIVHDKENYKLHIRFMAQAFEVETGKLLHGSEHVTTIELPKPKRPVAVQQPPEPEPTLMDMLIPWALPAIAFLVVLLALLVFARAIKKAYRPR